MNQATSHIQNVLVIDDDADIRFALKRIIESCDYTVDVADSWAEAAKQLSTLTIDVVFCDLRFPGDVPGDEILRLIKLHYPEIKVVVMSCAMDDSICSSLKSDGASYCIQKPFFKNECKEVMLYLSEIEFFETAKSA